jgi:Bacterial SCP ortholog
MPWLSIRRQFHLANFAQHTPKHFRSCLDNFSMRDAQVLKEVKETLALLTERAPGRAIEVRVPPYAAVQCGDGPTHTRGTPANVIEMDAQTWLALANGERTWADAMAAGLIIASGVRADLTSLLPLKIAP